MVGRVRRVHSVPRSWSGIDRAHKARERIIANLKSVVEERKGVIAREKELGEDGAERKDVLENLLSAQDEQGNVSRFMIPY